jgi:hypothetical protein
MEGETKMNKNMVFLFALCFCSLNVSINGQTFDLEKFNKEKEQILNIVINSVQFDSVYSSRRVYFVANELLSEESSLVLKRNKCKAVVRQREGLKGKEYIALGDFTMNRNNATHVRVQLEILPRNVLLNLRLEKNDGVWKIVNHLIIAE